MKPLNYRYVKLALNEYLRLLPRPSLSSIPTSFLPPLPPSQQFSLRPPDVTPLALASWSDLVVYKSVKTRAEDCG